MNITLIGTSHKHAPIDIRERIAFSDNELPEALSSILPVLAEEAVLISTCNRTELYVVSQNGLNFDDVIGWLSRYKSTPLDQQHFYSLQGLDAAKHLFDVASGIDSQIVGDIQVTGQVREAYHIAQTNGSTGKLLSRLFDFALHTAKRVKTETNVFSGAVSISYVAVELAKKIFYPISDKSILVVGAGETGELTARNVYAQGVRAVTVANRTAEHTEDLIKRLGFGEAMSMDRLGERLHEFDVVIVSTGASEFIITEKMARAAMSRRSGATQLIVDISVPRNVEPSVGDVPGIFCKDLNDLTNVIAANQNRRLTDLAKAELIIAEELTKFTAWCNLLPVTPIISQLQSRGAEIMRSELDKNRRRFSEADFVNVEKLVASVVRKLIGMPLQHLLDSEAELEHVLLKAEYVKVLFNLEPPADERGTTVVEEHIETDNGLPD